MEEWINPITLANIAFDPEKITPAELADIVLNEVKERFFIFTLRETEEIYLVVNNEIRGGDTYLRELIMSIMEMRGRRPSTAFIEETLRLIRIKTYRSREEVYDTWDSIYTFENGIYLDIENLEIVKPSLSFMRRLVDFFGEDYNRVVTAMSKLLNLYDEDPGSVEPYLAYDKDHFLENLVIGRGAPWSPGRALGVDFLDIPQDFYTVMSMLPIKKFHFPFDPEAKAPTFVKFIEDTVPPEFRTTLQRFMGYTLLPDNRYQKFLVLLGSGSNGKSTFLEVFKEMFGKYAASVPLQELAVNRFAIAYLENKLVNIFDDLPQSRLAVTGKLKQLVTNNGKLTVERKHKDQYEAKIYAKMIFAANSLPRTSDDSIAFFRRWLIVDFPRKFDGANADPFMARKLKKELPGIFNWMLAGLYWLRETGDFGYPLSIDDVVSKYYAASSPVGAFVEDCIEITSQDPDCDMCMLPKDEVYQRFLQYCKERGYPTKVKNVFSMEFTKYTGAKEHRPQVEMPDGTKARVRHYLGVFWKIGSPCDETSEGEEDDEEDYLWVGYEPETIPDGLVRRFEAQIHVYEATTDVTINGDRYYKGDFIYSDRYEPELLEELVSQGKIKPLRTFGNEPSEATKEDMGIINRLEVLNALRGHVSAVQEVLDDNDVRDLEAAALYWNMAAAVAMENEENPDPREVARLAITLSGFTYSLSAFLYNPYIQDITARDRVITQGDARYQDMIRFLRLPSEAADAIDKLVEHARRYYDIIKSIKRWSP